jgi:hypothetical protein
LGAGTAWLFAVIDQITGPYAALAFGFAAPAVLAQLGGCRAPGADALEGGTGDPRDPSGGPGHGAGAAVTRVSAPRRAWRMALGRTDERTLAPPATRHPLGRRVPAGLLGLPLRRSSTPRYVRPT